MNTNKQLVLVDMLFMRIPPTMSSNIAQQCMKEMVKKYFGLFKIHMKLLTN